MGICETKRNEGNVLTLKSGLVFYQNNPVNSGGVVFLVNKLAAIKDQEIEQL